MGGRGVGRGVQGGRGVGRGVQRGRGMGAGEAVIEHGGRTRRGGGPCHGGRTRRDGGRAEHGREGGANLPY